jgi:hypothetical protein
MQRGWDFVFRSATGDLPRGTLWTIPCAAGGFHMSDHAYIVREEARLLGGSVSDWMVLVGGVLLAGFVAAVMAL